MLTIRVLARDGDSPPRNVGAYRWEVAPGAGDFVRVTLSSIRTRVQAAEHQLCEQDLTVTIWVDCPAALKLWLDERDVEMAAHEAAVEDEKLSEGE